MQILESDLFTNELNIILSFIVRKESIKVKNTFKNDLYKALKKLDFMPYKFRKSLAFDDENVRDFLFKGYVIPYKIDKEKDLIIILGIYKENLPNF
ncbi:type II toxin-antitoxin system RelE/ParE family toxin [Campylobacter coli]|nr:type II toxin-antitoxin system RelE/ParE family toxin [Campylobacter coli]EAJ0474437.1 type II toxin-antitoxin system RelE/ParE family toxin [Campylobacter coli]EBF6021065.1 type II toxin-antitoxin system RelE/ParE family toxin [Campylobacter coli]EGB8859414.1 type II toxin-antitoxin system RelE/ParE family toxin [Campylobacter coli]ELZ8922659.1 type II toxin-antitoxin system RelE/ParE family toxin [Campylobacter coli]